MHFRGEMLQALPAAATAGRLMHRMVSGSGDRGPWNLPAPSGSGGQEARLLVSG
jgi:hypothetical protein